MTPIFLTVKTKCGTVTHTFNSPFTFVDTWRQAIKQCSVSRLNTTLTAMQGGKEIASASFNYSEDTERYA